MELPDGRFVPDTDRVFLRPEEVLAAIREDFAQYPSQPRLLMNLCPVILAPGRAVEDGNHRGVWIRSGPGGKMQLISYRRFGKHLCDAMASTPPSLTRLALICRMVFQGRAVAGQSEGVDGIWIDTGMESFSCLRCGHCCRDVGYPREAGDIDVTRWKAAGRSDIMKWVGLEIRRDEDRVYRIWIDPDTGRPADKCPWLIRVPGSHLYKCGIHDEKPEICRLYPGSRKHAVMTGCRGFEKTGLGQSKRSG